MITLALINSKPGTGKTTCAVWLAHALMEHGLPVLLVDADPAASALEWGELAGGFPFRYIGLPVRNLHQRLPDIRRPGEVVVIDAPQTEDHAAIATSVMLTATQVIIPVSPTPIEVNRTRPMLVRLAEISQQRSPLRAGILLNRTVANALSTTEAREALTGLGFDVLAGSVPRLEMFGQSFGAAVYATGTVWQHIAAELLTREGADDGR